MTQFKSILDIIPSAIASRTFGAISSVRFPHKIQHIVNKGFATLAQLDISEAEKNIDDYDSLNELFTRELKSDARTIDSADVVSPVDGNLSFFAP